MMNVVPLDPDLPRQKRSMRSALTYSALSILLIMVVLGAIPQLGAALNAVDHLLRAHNDAIVTTLTAVLPLSLVGLGSFFLIYRLLGRLNKQQRS